MTAVADPGLGRRFGAWLQRAAWLAWLLAVAGGLAGPSLAEAPAPPDGERISRSGSGEAEAARDERKKARRDDAAPEKRRRSKQKRSRSKRDREADSLEASWHSPGTVEQCEALADAPPGSWGLMSLCAKTCFAIPPAGDDGYDEPTRERLREAFVDKRRGEVHDIDERLLQVLERAVREFDVPYVHLVSGYRPGRAASRHAHGLAADVVFPGVSNKRLARFMRKQGFMGVGVYMRTGFVHVDLRERSYFWLDWSPPGKKWRGKPILMSEAKAADEAAIERGETPFAAPERLRRAVDAGKARRARAEAARKRREAAAAKRRAEAKRRRAKARRRAAAKRRAEERRAEASPPVEVDRQP